MLPAEVPVTPRRAPLPTLDDPSKKTRQFVKSSIEFTAGRIDSRFGHDGSSAVEGAFRDPFNLAVVRHVSAKLFAAESCVLNGGVLRAVKTVVPGPEAKS